MVYYYIAGVSLGVVLPHYLTESQFKIAKTCLLGPYYAFKELKKEKLKIDMAMDPSDYIKYIKLTSKGILNIIYYFAVEERNFFKLSKQNAVFSLIENFEFVKETIQNFDYIKDNLNKVNNEIMKEAVVFGSYKHLALLEEETKAKFFSPEEQSLNHIQKLEGMVSDDYEKYLIKNAITSKKDYYRSLTPEFRLQKEQNKLDLISQYHESIGEFNRQKMGDDLFDKTSLIRNQLNRLAQNKLNEEQENTEQKIQDQKQRKVKEIEPLSKKYPTIKNVEKEIETLKEIFGAK